MKRFLVLAALVLGLASCQTEPEGLNVNVGGEVETTVCVSLPETTRANSAEGAFENVDPSEYTIRYILQVYDNNGTASKERLVKYSDEKSVAFDVRLVPDRDYNFVVWADVVKGNNFQENEWKNEDGLHYDTTDLHNITLKETWVAMDETRDAFTGYFNTADGDKRYSAGLPINITLTRPFAKLRVVTTDMVELGHLGIKPHNAVATYTTAHYSTFNACNATYSGELTNVSHEYVIASYNETGANKTIFTDYFFANNEVVKFNLDVKEENGETIKANTFNTDINVKRNHLTTIKGNILTDGKNFNVEIEDSFENVDNNGNTTNPNYDYKTISSAAEFYAAANGTGGKYIVISNFTLSGISTTSYAATRSSTGGKVVEINLNGMTITVDNNTPDALINLGGNDALIISGEGTIEGTGKLVDGGNVVVTGAAEVDSDVADVKTGIEALKYILENGGKFTFTEDLTINEVILVATTNPVVINGANHTLTSNASRAIRATVANANIVVNDLNIVVETERVGSNDIRGISIDNVTGVELTLNNCSVIFNHPSGNDWAYAVNVTGGSNHNVTINGGTYNGANVINVRGSENTVIIKNATLTSLYPNNDMYFGACIYVVQNENSSVYAEGNTFNGNNAWAFNIGYTPLEEKNNTDNTKYVAAKVGDVYYYNIAEAIAAAEDGATVKVLQRHDCNVGATVAAGKTITLDLNGKTITGTDSSTGSYALITNKGNLTITGNGKMTLKAENNREWNAYSSVISNTVGGKLVVENGTIEHLGGTDMAYGIDNLTNGKGTYAETVINGGTIKSTYRAVRMFLNGIEADNILTVNGGTIEGDNKSIWMQDPSKNANTGTLVVSENAILKGNAYLTVTAGSTEWPVEVSIADDAFEGESTLLSSNVPEGYVVMNANGVWTVKSGLNAAIAMDEDGILTLEDDIEISEPVVVEGREFVIDLNGKTVTAPLSSAFVAKDGAELTIKNGKVIAYESTVRAIGGKAIIESGEYTSTGTALDSPSTYRYSLDCREGGELIINGGTFKSNNGMINVGSTVTINGGKFENIVEKTMTRHFAYVSALLTINDGEFYGKANSSAGGCFFCGAAKTGYIQVNGGKFTSLWISGSVNRIFESYSAGSTINVTGGMFNTNGGIANFVVANTDEATKAAYPYVAK